jgi:predicted permease
MSRPGERLFGLLLRLYPREFRRRYRDDLLAFFRQDREHPRYGRGLGRPIRFWEATLRDLLRAAMTARAVARRAAPEVRVRRGWRGWGANLGMDLRFGWRGLWSSPGVTASALAVLTLGIGASTAIFSVVDAVVLRGLPFDDADRLVAVSESDLLDGNRPVAAAWVNYVEWLNRQDGVFSGLAASRYAGLVTTLAGAGPVEQYLAVGITPSLFDVLRLAPAMGRAFNEADTQVGAPAVAVISDRLWRRRFAAASDVIGRRLAFENGSYEIVGVMPPGFTYPVGSPLADRIEFWMPIVPGPRDTDRAGGRNYNLTVVARLAPGVTIERARTRMGRIRDALAVEHPRWFEDHGVTVRDLHTAVVGAETRGWMLLLLAAVGGVLLIACLNVANLLLARAVGRSREIAVRAALGASRWDLARGLIVESLLLSALGTICGVLLAVWGVELLRSALPDRVPRLATVAVDLRVLGVAAMGAVATGLMFGALPALKFSRTDAASLNRGGRSQVGTGAGQRIRGALVTAEVALAVVLLAGAALFAASFVRVLNVDIGIDPRHVVAVGVNARVPSGPSRLGTSQALILDALARVQALPGVEAAAAVGGGLPLSGSYMTQPVSVPGRAEPFTGADELVLHGATPEYLETLGSSLVRGRWFNEADEPAAPAVVVLSEEAARRYFPGEDPVGRTLTVYETPRVVVGILRDVRHGGPEWGLRPEGFVPYVQSDQPSATIAVRAHGVLAGLTRQVEDAIRAAIPNAVLYDPQRLDDRFASLVAERKFNMIILGLFGVLAVLIAAIGVYGLMAFLVAQRNREIGLRIALGALPAGVMRMVLGRASQMLGIGLVAGLLAAALLERLVRAFLFEARPHEPVVYVAVALVLLTTGLVAAFGPARRAAKVDPLAVLRME